MIRLYMDENVRGPITEQLRRQGLDVLRAQEDIPAGTPDDQVLDRSTALGCVLYSEDDDLLAEATSRQRRGVPFAGVIYGHQLRVSIGQAVRDLEFLVQVGAPEDFAGQVIFLPYLR
jgi:Domain of unknown function (DUF5615)